MGELNNKNISLLLSLMLTVFCISKVLRGVDVAGGGIGGIWNIISLLYYVLVVIYAYTRRKIKASFLLLCGLAYSVFSIITSLYYIQSISISKMYSIIMIPFFLVVMFVFKNQWEGNRSDIRIVVIAFWGVLVINAYTIIMYRLGLAPRPFASDIYYLLCLLPFYMLFHTSEKQFKFAMLLLVLIMFISGKRTGFLAVSVALIAYMAVSAFVSGKDKFKTFFILAVKIIAAVVIIGGIVLYVDDYFSIGMMKRLMRLADDGGSGRDIIYRDVWRGFAESGFLQKMFGHGNFATDAITGMQAHNDYLEVLYDYGIAVFIPFMGILFYMLYWGICLIRRKSRLAPAFSASIVASVFLSMFSFFFIYFTYVTALAAFWGISLNPKIGERYGV